MMMHIARFLGICRMKPVYNNPERARKRFMGQCGQLTTVYIKCVTDRLVMLKKDVEEKEDL